MRNALWFTKKVVGALLLVSGIAQLLGLPGDIPSWLKLISGAQRLRLPQIQFNFDFQLLVNLGMIVVGLLLLLEPWNWLHGRSGASVAMATQPETKIAHAIPAPVYRGMAGQVRDQQREAASRDTFGIVQGDLGTRPYSRSEVDRLSETQRTKLFESDPAMKKWWQGVTRSDDAWTLFRLPGATGPQWKRSTVWRRQTGINS